MRCIKSVSGGIGLQKGDQRPAFSTTLKPVQGCRPPHLIDIKGYLKGAQEGRHPMAERGNSTMMKYPKEK
jgi:hypothetical protein